MCLIGYKLIFLVRLLQLSCNVRHQYWYLDQIVENSLFDKLYTGNWKPARKAGLGAQLQHSFTSFKVLEISIKVSPNYTIVPWERLVPISMSRGNSVKQVKIIIFFLLNFDFGWPKHVLPCHQCYLTCLIWQPFLANSVKKIDLWLKGLNWTKSKKVLLAIFLLDCLWILVIIVGIIQDQIMII